MLKHLHKQQTFAIYQCPSIIEKTILFVIIQPPGPLPLFNVEVRSVDTITWLQH